MPNAGKKQRYSICRTCARIVAGTFAPWARCLVIIVLLLVSSFGRQEDAKTVRVGSSDRQIPIKTLRDNLKVIRSWNKDFGLPRLREYAHQEPKRGAEVVYAEGQQKTRFVRNGKDYALLIATDDYDHWPQLSNPVNDAKAVAEALKEYYGFEVEVIANPTKKETRDAILRYKREKKYSEEDQLFIFIAGHGTFLEEWKKGFIVFKDSEKDDDLGDSYISHKDLKDTIDLIDCKHILLVIDSCFSGAIDDAVARRGGDDEYKDATNPVFIERNLRYPTRRYLTSGGKEYVPDGRPGQHSPFARKLLDALRNGGGQDGILTITGILSYMEKITPEPHHNGWGKDEPGSNFLFIAKPK